MSETRAPPLQEEAIIPQANFYSSMGLSYENAYGNSPGLLGLLDTAVTMLSPSKPAVILDAGCGTGRPTSSTLSAAGHTIHGIDIADNMLALSAAAVPLGHFEKGDIRTWTPSAPLLARGGFGAIFALFSLFLMSRPEIDEAMARFARWLKPGGLLFIATIAADDSEEQGTAATWWHDGRSAEGFVYLFMGLRQSMTLLTRRGWTEVLAEKGMEVVEMRTVPYVPPPGVESEPNLDLFVIARRTAE